MPTNPVGTWQDIDYTSPSFSGTGYPLGIDGNMAVAKRVVDNFAPRPQSTPNMTIKVDAGHLWDGVTLTERGAQNTASFTAPVTNPRIDRVVADNLTGFISVVAGTENASPVPPAIPAGKFPIAQVLLATSTTALDSTTITDERAVPVAGGASAIIDISGGVATLIAGYNVVSVAYVSTGTFTVTFGPGSVGKGACVTNARNGGIAYGPALRIGTPVVGPNNTVTFAVRDYTNTLVDPTEVTLVVM